MDEAIEFKVTRSETERWAGRPLTDEEWEMMKEEISDFLRFHTDRELESLTEQIEDLMEDR